MDEITIHFTEAPIQSLMNYVFENYRELKDFCEIEGESKNDEECANCHHNSYFGRGNPKYECDNFRRVYLIRFLARQFEQSDFLIKTHLLRDIKGKTNLSAVSLGGGPAPEALALMNELSSCEGDYNLFFDNIDCEASWEKIYLDITHQFANCVKNVKLQTGFHCYNVNSYTSEKRYDIVFISWFLSDMGEQDRSNILEVARNLATHLGYILVMDRYERQLVAKISAHVNDAQGLTLLDHKDKLTFHSIVDFPPDIKGMFGPDMGCDFSYWVLQSFVYDF